LLRKTEDMPSKSFIRQICITGTNQKIYTQLNKEEAECELCKGNGARCRIKTKDGNTSGLVAHLKQKHKDSDEFFCSGN